MQEGSFKFQRFLRWVRVLSLSTLSHNTVACSQQNRDNRINQINNNNVAAAINEKFKADVTRYAKLTEQDIAAQKKNNNM